MLKFLLVTILLTITSYAKVEYQKYCSDKSLRETIVLIDLHDIDNKLFGKVIKNLNYTPNEKVNIYAFDGKTNEIQTVMEYCYPKFTKQKIEEIQKNSSTFRLGANDYELMLEDQAFFNAKLTKKLTLVRSKIVKRKEGNFQNALSSLTKDINPYSRLIIFTTRNLKNSNPLDFNFSNIYIYNKHLSSKSKTKILYSYFDHQNANFKGTKSRYTNNYTYDNRLKNISTTFHLLVKDKKVKAHVKGLFKSSGQIENMWFVINGVIQAPLKGKVEFKNDSSFIIRSKIPRDISMKNNNLRKNDQLLIKVSNGETNGKFFNYSFVFSDNKNEYFEYKVVK